MNLTYPLILYYLNQTTLFLGFPILFLGLVGNGLTCIIFLSLRTFRNNPCAFYLMINSFINNIHLITGFFTRLMVNGFSIDWTVTSIFYCKFRAGLSQFAILLSLSCICLATIDQFLATSSNDCRRRKSNMKIVHRLVIIATMIWILHGIPYVVTSSIQSGSCAYRNTIFLDYIRYIYFPVLLGFLPLSLMNVFSILSLRNILGNHRFKIPLIRRELDRQLMKMILTQVMFTTVTSIPFIVHYTYLLSSKFNDQTIFLKHQFIAAILNIIWHISFSAPLYIYYCSSRRFRKQLHYVCCKTNYRISIKSNMHQNKVSPEHIAVTITEVPGQKLTK